MNYPKELSYAQTHEWVQKLPDGKLRVGISDFAQDALGDVVFVNLPMEGDAVTIGTAFADVESVKAVSEIFSPANGVVTAVNEFVLNNPEAVNEDPYGAWLIEVGEVTEVAQLLSSTQYGEHTQKEG